MWYGSLVERHGSVRPLALYQLNNLRLKSCRVDGMGTEDGGIEAHIIPRVRIYTKTGDSGETSLFDNSRVSKSHPRVEAYGEVDELNACLGAARAAGADPDLDSALETIQRQLFAVGARRGPPAPIRISTPRSKPSSGSSLPSGRGWPTRPRALPREWRKPLFNPRTSSV